MRRPFKMCGVLRSEPTGAPGGASNHAVRHVTLALALSLIGAAARADPPAHVAAAATKAGAPTSPPAKQPARAEPPRQAPPPKTIDYLDVGCRWSRGALTVTDVTAGRFPTPTAIRRFTGR